MRIRPALGRQTYEQERHRVRQLVSHTRLVNRKQVRRYP